MHNAREKTKTRRKFVSRVPDQWRRHFIQQQKMKRNMINSRDKHRVCIFVLISFVCWQEASVSNGIFYRETFLILIFLMRDREIEKRTKPNVFSFRKSIFNSIQFNKFCATCNKNVFYHLSWNQTKWKWIHNLLAGCEFVSRQPFSSQTWGQSI